MLKTRVDRVRVKGEKGIAPAILIIVLAIALLIIMLFVIPWINLQIRCGDCSDVKYSNFGGEETWTMEEVRFITINYDKGNTLGEWLMMYHSPTQGHSVYRFYATLDDLESDIDNTDMPATGNGSKEHAHHIIDCIQRGCT